MLINISLREESLIQDGLEVIRKVQPSWDMSRVKSKVFTDGIMNKLVGYFVDGCPDKVLLIKLYGQNTEVMIDRQCEINTMKLLHKKGLGPKLFAVLNNGICYEFVHGCTLNADTVRSPEVYPKVASEMAALHSTVDIIGDGVADDEMHSKMWNKVNTFNDLVEEVLQTNPIIADRVSKFGVFPGSGRRQINEIKMILEKEGIPIAFCHNDLLLANIIYNHQESKVSFIDFEYAMPNYIAFDVANHFLEFAGVDNPDFSKCPDIAFKSKWIAEYIKNFKMKNIQLDQTTFEKWVELCIPLAHLLWALWSIVQADNSTIDFDFIKYFGMRFEQYEKHINEIRSRAV